MSSLVHWHCVASGRVQGVFYRARVAEAAVRHGVVGSVANRSDGTVFIDVQGDLAAVEAFLREARVTRTRCNASRDCSCLPICSDSKSCPIRGAGPPRSRVPPALPAGTR